MPFPGRSAGRTARFALRMGMWVPPGANTALRRGNPSISHGAACPRHAGGEHGPWQSSASKWQLRASLICLHGINRSFSGLQGNLGSRWGAARPLNTQRSHCPFAIRGHCAALRLTRGKSSTSTSTWLYRALADKCRWHPAALLSFRRGFFRCRRSPTAPLLRSPTSHAAACPRSSDDGFGL